MKSLRNITQELSLLYVEDDKTSRDTTIELFENLFKNILVAVDGQEGLLLYEEYFQTYQKHIDIVITDIQMPQMNGIELCKDIFCLHKHQKVLVLSAYDDKKYLIELINMGVAGFIQKPLGSEQLTSTLFNVVEELQEKQELFRFVKLGCGYTWDKKHESLSKEEELITLTVSEIRLFSLLTQDTEQVHSSLDIFEHIYADEDKAFSLDTIKSLVKRLRKKLTHEIITNIPRMGYQLKGTSNINDTLLTP